LRRQHVGVTAAVNQQGRMSFELTREKERFTAKIFIRFIKKMQAEHPRRFLSLIVDGAPIHKAKIVKSFVADNQKWLRLEILPAYSPELNPTEKSWRFLKTKKLNASAAKSKADLRKTVVKALRATKKDQSKVTEFFNNLN
jgi:transposase